MKAARPSPSARISAAGLTGRLLIVGLCALVPAVAMAQKSSALALDAVGHRLLVANADSASVSLIDTNTLTVLAEIGVGRNPQALLLDAGNRLLVTNHDEDTLSVVDLAAGNVLACVPLADEPFGLVADEKYLFVANAGANSVTVKDRITLETVTEIAVLPEPRGLTLSVDARLYVTHFLSGRISVIDTESFEILGVIDTGSGAMLSQNLVLDPASALAYAPHTLANTANESLLFDTTVFPVVSVIDTAQRVNQRGDRIALDIADEPVSIPLDAALSADDLLYVVNAGSNDVSVVDLAKGRAVAHLATGANPRSIVLDEAADRAYVSNTLDGSITVLDTALHQVIREVAVTILPLAPPVLEGKRLFNSADDTALAKDQWIACSTCHFDGRHDGRTWFFPDGPRNTPSLLGVAATLPVHWSGDLDELQDVESTIRNIQAGTGLTSGDSNCDPACDRAPANAGRSASLDALAAYMETLELPVSPLQAQSLGMSAAALRGGQLFASSAVGCASCHVPPLYTDNLMHDVGTVGPAEPKGTRLNTPSLLGLARTAPYLHDGTMGSLTVLLYGARAGRHGNTAGLDAAQLADLQQFLLELPAPHGSSSTGPLCGLPRAARVDLQAAVSRSGALTRGDRVTLDVYADAPTAVDLYLGVIFPDGSFKTLQEEGRFGAYGQVARAKRLAAASAGVTVPLLDFSLRDYLPPGKYSLVLVTTLPGADFNRREHWLDLDRVEVEVGSFQ